MTRFSRFCSLILACSVFLLGGPSWRASQTPSSAQPSYLNPALPVDQRVTDLISRLTLEEKASLLVNQARAVPRLNLPAYDWWSESLHGVLTNGTTEFPEPVGLASTF